MNMSIKEHARTTHLKHRVAATRASRSRGRRDLGASLANYILVMSQDHDLADQTPRKTIVEVGPHGAGVDDSMTLQAVLDGAAYRYEVRLLPGVYTVSNRILVPSGTTLIGGPGVRIVSTIAPTPGGSPEATLFYAAPPAATILNVTLASPTVPGTRTITVSDASPFRIGDEIALTVENHTAGYVIAGITGDTITVDRPIVHSFAAGVLVIDRIAPKDIRFYCDGMVVTGTGDAIIEWSGAWRCTVQGLIVTAESGSVSDVCVNFDVGSRDCQLIDCELDGGGTAGSCWHFESAERCRAERVYARRAVGQAAFLSSGSGNELNQCAFEESTVGLAVNTAVASGTSGGTKNLSIVGCTFTANTGIGLDIRNASRYIEVVNCAARYNGGTGFAVNSGIGPSGDVHFANCSSTHNQAGFYVVAGCRGVQCHNITADACALYGLKIDGEAVASGFVSRGCGAGAVQVGVAGRASVNHARIESNTTGSFTAFTQTSTDPLALRIRDADVHLTGSGTKIAISSQAGGTTYAEGLAVNTTGASGTTYGWVASAGTFYRGPRVEVGATTNPYTGGTAIDTQDHPLTPTVTKTEAYTAVVGDLVLCDPTSGGFTVMLPPASRGDSGRRIGIKNASASTNGITVARHGSQLIDGGVSATITASYAYLELRSTGTGWVIV